MFVDIIVVFKFLLIAGVKVWLDSNLIQILMIFGAFFSRLQNSKSKKQYIGVISVMCHFI